MTITWLGFLLLFSGAARAGLIHEWMMKTSGTEPAMINAPNVLRDPGTGAAIKLLTINPNTGILYGVDSGIWNNGRPQLWLLDSTIISAPSAPVSALVGSIGDPLLINTNQYSGSVPEGPKNRNGPAGSAITFNPEINEGVLLAWSGGYSYTFQAFAAQPSEAPDGDNNNDWGHTRESNGVSTIAHFASSSGYLIWADNNGSREGLGFLDKATITGTDAGERHRYVCYPFRYSDATSDSLRIYHLPTTYTVTPTDSSVGTWAVVARPGSSILMNQAQIEALRPAGTINGLAVRKEVYKDVFDIYMLFTSSVTTYVAAVQATIPSDGTAMSCQPIDLDIYSTNNWIRLKDTLADKDIDGTGLAFSKDGETMYVASYLDYSTGNSAYDQGRIYIFNRRLLKGTVVVFR